MSSSVPRQSPSTPSASSVGRNSSPGHIHTSRHLPPLITTVITTPPWAHDEPPSPNDDNLSITETNAPELRLPDISSHHQASTIDLRSRWWTFALPRTPKLSRDPTTWASSVEKSENSPIRDLSKAWLPTSVSLREGVRKDKQRDIRPFNSGGNLHRDSSLPGTFPPVHNPGWDSPWAPHIIPRSVANLQERNNFDPTELDGESRDGDDDAGVWQKRKKRLRGFILTNVYVPLLFRFINVTFTTSALAVAIHIRLTEIKGGLLGVVGSSPALVIIFAPLTLVHVVIAIYLEYFGRPLGLWRTSGKLMHTLSEVLFICAWSAAFSLSFDNFFTSPIPCASASRLLWYSQLPRPPIEVPNAKGRLGNSICDYQLALICLVGVGLMAYCANLIISLFRIFEKVKYHSAVRIAR